MGADPPGRADMSAALQALWRLAAGQPQLLAAHAAGYAALIRDEGAVSLRLVQRRAGLQALLFGSVIVALVLTGVAVMGWAIAPAGSLSHPWVLLAVPALPWLLAAWALRAARRVGPLPLWAAWQEQLAADRALLRRRPLR